MAASIARGQFCPGDQFEDIHPGAEPVGFQGGTKPFGRSTVFLHVGDKHLGPARLEAAAFGRVRVENTQPVNFYCVPFGECT